MKGRRFLDFMLMRPAFSARNLTSFGLVLLFFFIYVASGGQISWAPKGVAQRTGGFIAPTVDDADVTGDVVEQRLPERREPVAPKRETSSQAPGPKPADENLERIKERLQNLGRSDREKQQPE